MKKQPYLQRQFARIGRVIPKAIYNDVQVSFLVTPNTNKNILSD